MSRLALESDGLLTDYHWECSSLSGDPEIRRTLRIPLIAISWARLEHVPRMSHVSTWITLDGPMMKPAPVSSLHSHSEGSVPRGSLFRV